MKMSGSIRRTELKRRRFIASWQSPPLFALPDGTVSRAPDAGQSEPGSSFCLARKGHSARFPSRFRHTHSYLLNSFGTAGLVGVDEESFP